MIFVVIGPTGSGKTNFINALAGKPGDGGAAYLNAGTRSITSHTVERDGRRLIFVDTPGLDSTYLPDTGIFALIAKWLETNHRPNIEIGIIYLHRITDTRIQGSPQGRIEMLRKQCSRVVVRQICLVTTMWDIVDEVDTAETDERETFLKGEFQKQSVHALFKRFDNQHSSAWDAIDGLIQDHPSITTVLKRSNDKLNMAFIVMGPTGSGKTNFINAVSGTSDDNGASDMTAGTQSVIPRIVERDGRHLVFVDTPGLDNTHFTDAEIFTLISKWLETDSERNTELGVIYLHRITDNRVKGSPHKHIEMLRKQCNDVAVRQICLVTTMWDEVDNTDATEAEERERFLKEEFQKQKIHALFKRFDNERSSAWDAVNELIRDHPSTARSSTRSNDKPNNMIFVVMGPTGSGKTNFINAVAGLSGENGAGNLTAGTRSVILRTVERDGRHLVFVDTPGLDNTHLTDAEIFTLVAKWLRASSRRIIELGIIYLHRITDNRVQDSPHKHIEMFRKQCSGVVVRQICLVTTMWDEVDHTDTAEAEANDRERFLKEEFEKQNVHALFKRFDNQRSSAMDITSSLVGSEARCLQEELEELERRLNELGTERESYAQLQQLLSQRRDVLQHLIAQAAMEGNMSRVQDLQADLDILNTQRRPTFEEIQERNASLISRVLQWLARKLGRTTSVSSFSAASYPETRSPQYNT